jgi:collagenase-like PrtC family protease
VRGVTGLWVEAPTGLAQVDGEAQAYNEKYLFWEEDGLTFVVLSNTLSQAEMLKVAESLAY